MIGVFTGNQQSDQDCNEYLQKKDKYLFKNIEKVLALQLWAALAMRLWAFVCSPSSFAFYLAQDPGVWPVPLTRALGYLVK